MVNFVMGDASVQPFRTSIDYRLYNGLGTKAGGEAVVVREKEQERDMYNWEETPAAFLVLLVLARSGRLQSRSRPCRGSRPGDAQRRGMA